MSACAYVYDEGLMAEFWFCLAVQELQTKEIKNARLAMVAFVGFIVSAQATGQVCSNFSKPNGHPPFIIISE